MVDHPQHGTGEVPLGQGERIAKVLARAGVASRREVERMIEAGRVAINGRPLQTPAVKVGPGDIVTLDGAVVNEAEPTRLFRYHKPAGLVTTHADPKGRRTVFQALPEGLPRVISVGRLDLNSEGLLLLTNDGELARALELPSNGWVRRYRARAHGRVDQAALDRLKDGLTIEGVRYGPITARLDKAKEGPTAANVWVTLDLAEGKNREVRKVLEALGLTVNRLIRLAYGPFALATLPAGAVEEVGPRVIREQLAQHIAPENLPKGDRAAFRPAPVAAGPTPARRAGGAGAASDVQTHAPAGPAKTRGAKYKPGWAKAKVKSSGPPPAGGRSSGPRGPKRSVSPPRNSAARPPGPRPGGGRGRRGPGA
ncbi:MAG: pseudouridine synthase [Caulobacterales bacterium]